MQLQHIATLMEEERPAISQFYYRMYLRTLIPLFQQYDDDTLDNISRAMVVNRYNKDDTIYSVGSPANMMYIVVTGLVVAANTELSPQFSFGEKGFKSANDETRDHNAVAIQNDTMCLSLSKREFQDLTFQFEHVQKGLRMSYIQSLTFSRKWEFEKLQHFNSELE